MAIKNVALIGAGGNVGPHVLNALDKSGFDVTIISHKSSKSTFDGRKVIQVSDNWPEEELVAAFKGIDAVVSNVPAAHGPTINGGQERLIDAAIKAGVKRFIPSEFGGDNRNKAGLELCPVYQDKLPVIKYLQERQDKISWTAVITGPFFDFGLRVGFLGPDMQTKEATITEGGSTKFTTTTLPQTGLAVAAVLAHDTETANKYVAIESFSTTQNELVAAMEKEGLTVKKTYQTGQELIDKSRAGVAAGNQFAVYGLLQATIFIPGYGGDFSAEADSWRTVLGLEKLDLKTEMKKLLAEP